MKTKLQNLAYPKLKSVYNYQQVKSDKRTPDTDPITVTVATVSHIFLNK
ncbi:hypothetical protein [Mucilaginibacter ginkgonis]|uniref:Uncharacterized protein n=1 Tax=Mucilaginibacter ginkgonis TaxID=2682091 RepID=A0A6I4HZP5_9SPHI|nr:hypothetical protein [Mucilaginibacter ginkgonis]QQL48905.1 hypothetical protein GO620_012035 [Mucilaginibacter ginkgonis]